MDGHAIAKTESLDYFQELSRRNRKRDVLHTLVDNYIADRDAEFPDRAIDTKRELIDSLAAYRRAAMRYNSAERKLAARTNPGAR